MGRGGFGLLPGSGALKGARLGQIFLLCLVPQTGPGRLGCVTKQPHLQQSWTANYFLLAVSVEEADVLLG